MNDPSLNRWLPGYPMRFCVISFCAIAWTVGVFALNNGVSLCVSWCILWYGSVCLCVAKRRREKQVVVYIVCVLFCVCVCFVFERRWVGPRRWGTTRGMIFDATESVPRTS
jgi:cell division protein FtsW (lipid II flippase)